MPPRQPDDGFEKGDSRNLPPVTAVTLANFFTKEEFVVYEPEVRHDKTERSTREAYGDKAVGFVQVKRADGKCHVKACVTPEHKVKAPPYNVHCIVDEKKEEIVEAYCDDCAASEGCCKHVVALVAWLHRRYEEPSPTSITAYWKKSALSKIGTDIKIKAVSEMVPPKKSSANVSEESKALFFASCSEISLANCQQSLLSMSIKPFQSYSIHHLLNSYKETPQPHSAARFLLYCQRQINQETCDSLEVQTRLQSKCSLWHDLHYGRVTASKIHEAANCHTEDGSFIKGLQGARKIKTKAMERGLDLEDEVLEVVSKTLAIKISPCGLVLRRENPHLGASPDGLSKHHVFEVKCPVSEKTFQTYFTKDFSAPSEKYLQQIMQQMFFCKRKKGYFCVAHPDFKKSKSVKILSVDFDHERYHEKRRLGTLYWMKYVYPKLYASA